MTIGKRIKELRDYHGLTQEEFAERIKYKRPYITMIENQTRQPSDRFLRDVCRVFGIKKEWLAEGRGDMRQDETAFIETILHSLPTLEDGDREIIASYLKLPPEQRRAFRKFLDELITQKKR